MSVSGRGAESVDEEVPELKVSRVAEVMNTSARGRAMEEKAP